MKRLAVIGERGIGTRKKASKSPPGREAGTGEGKEKGTACAKISQNLKGTTFGGSHLTQRSCASYSKLARRNIAPTLAASISRGEGICYS